MLARQALYHLSHSTSLTEHKLTRIQILISTFFGGGSTGGFELRASCLLGRLEPLKWA
jgi:hypothetical protein